MVLTRAIRRNIPQGAILHSHRRENLKSHHIITKKNSKCAYLEKRIDSSRVVTVADAECTTILSLENASLLIYAINNPCRYLFIVFAFNL
jgi:hypothetical protein